MFQSILFPKSKSVLVAVFCWNSIAIAQPDVSDIDISSFFRSDRSSVRLQKASVLPAEALAKLKKHALWRTSTLIKVHVFDQTLLTSWITKKWQVDMGEGDSNSVVLKEITKSSIRPKSHRLGQCQSATLSPEERNKLCKWDAGEVDLAKPFEMFDFDNITFATSEIELRYFNGEGLGAGFADEIGDGFADGFAIVHQNTYLVFSPSRSSDELPRKIQKNVRVWKAPLGLIEDILTGLNIFPIPYPIPLAKTYIIYDLKGNRWVDLDESFPTEHLESLKSALEKWNAALGKEFFLLNLEPKRLDPLECIASKNLCIFWRGPSKIAWNNFGGIAVPSFDPQTGIVQGGNIFVVNLAKGDLTPTPSTYLDYLKIDQIPYLLVPNLVMKREEFSKYLHPWANEFLESLFLHEIGHDAGLPHYFAGSNKGGRLNPDEYIGEKGIVYLPSDSVMDYIPFPAFHLNRNLGERDLQKLEAVYKGLPILNEMPCSDFMVGTPNCHSQDLGEPVLWYSYLSLSTAEGIFAEDPSAGGSSFRKARIIDRLIGYLVENDNSNGYQTQMVNRTFCLHPEKERILEILKNDYSKSMTCQ